MKLLVLKSALVMLALVCACGGPARITLPDSDTDTNESENEAGDDEAKNEDEATSDKTDPAPADSEPDPEPDPEDKVADTNPPPSDTTPTSPKPDAVTPSIFSQFEQAKGPLTQLNQTLVLDDFFKASIRSAGGSVAGGVLETLANDTFVGRLMFPGNEKLTSGDNDGPSDYSSQFKSDNKGSLFLYGTYETRFRAAKCATPAEGVVTGIFTYLSDGKDLNKNGIEDNSEIDIEVLCAEPTVLYLTIWIDYQDSNFIKTTRKIDLKTGTVSQTPEGKESSYGLKSTTALTYSFPAIDLTNEFIQIGFIWKADSVEYYLVRDSKTYTLWKFEKPTLIPQRAAYFLMNLWHNKEHWHNDAPADYPTKDVTLDIDWFKYFSP